jgi:hypothetical protein
VKQIPVILVAACCFGPNAALADEKPAEAPKRHRGEGRVYEKAIRASLIPPSGWDRTEDEGGARLMFRGPAGDGAPAVNVTTFKNSGAPITAVGAAMKKALARDNPDWQLADEGVVKIDGKNSYYFSSKFTRKANGDKKETQSIAFVVPGQSRGYVISFRVDAAKFDGQRSAIEDAAKSFRGD